MSTSEESSSESSQEESASEEESTFEGKYLFMLSILTVFEIETKLPMNP